MSPADRDIRLVELLPGGERITSRPLRFVAALDDRGDIAVRTQGPTFVTDLVPLLAAAVAAASAATGMPAAILGSAAGRDAEDALRRGGHHE